ncbi:hypothetical protein MMC30_008638, partial [Trapelia coarctata]|nr:hypothetical protein [Trapelia coarctata]
TEWCYNYHDPPTAYHCTTSAYPTPAEQHRFLKAYVQHRPQFTPSASSTPKTGASPGPSSSISSFMLDSRMPHVVNYAEEERKREEQMEGEIQRLMRETRLWRVANSAQWVAWGVVQAKVGGMDEALRTAKGENEDDNEGDGAGEQGQDEDTTPTQSPAPKPSDDQNALSAAGAAAPQHGHSHEDKRPEGLVAEALSSGHELPHEEDEEEEFDYLGYAQERAMFFWGDCLALGIVKEGDLPKEVLGKVKRVEY